MRSLRDRGKRQGQKEREKHGQRKKNVESKRRATHDEFQVEKKKYYISLKQCGREEKERGRFFKGRRETSTLIFSGRFKGALRENFF